MPYVSPDVSAAERLARRIGAAKPSGCVECGGARDKGGYVSITVRGQHWFAHRLAWTLKNGPIPDGLLVCHRCDNPPSVNPDHLFVGTSADNDRDMRAKGRAASTRGEVHYMTNFTDADVRLIKTDPRPGVFFARMFGVSKATISATRTGRNWGWLE